MSGLCDASRPRPPARRRSSRRRTRVRIVVDRVLRERSADAEVAALEDTAAAFFVAIARCPAKAKMERVVERPDAGPVVGVNGGAAGDVRVDRVRDRVLRHGGRDDRVLVGLRDPDPDRHEERGRLGNDEDVARRRRSRSESSIDRARRAFMTVFVPSAMPKAGMTPKKGPFLSTVTASATISADGVVLGVHRDVLAGDDVELVARRVLSIVLSIVFVPSEPGRRRSAAGSTTRSRTCPSRRRPGRPGRP